jgi:hypothetical protein
MILDEPFCCRLLTKGKLHGCGDGLRCFWRVGIWYCGFRISTPCLSFQPQSFDLLLQFAGGLGRLMRAFIRGPDDRAVLGDVSLAYTKS